MGRAPRSVQTAKTLTSGPSRKSSISTDAPASPKPPSRQRSTQAAASCRESVTRTPLPAASPSALTTNGPSICSRYRCAASGSAKEPDAAVATPAFAMISLAKAFDDSSRAAARLGPNTGMPSRDTASTTPAASGASGPTTTRSTPWTRAMAAIAPTSVAAIPSTTGPNSASPGLPGRDISSSRRGDWTSFHPKACSRPPLPTSRTLMRL